jgi:hypothetical protein
VRSVDAHFIPHSRYAARTNKPGQREITVQYVESGPVGVNYKRSITEFASFCFPARAASSAGLGGRIQLLP